LTPKPNNFKSKSNVNNKNGNYDSTGYSCYSTSNPRYDNVDNFFAYGFTFFSDKRQKHYDVLNENVFCPLSNLQPQVSSLTIMGDSLPQYDSNLPSYLFEDARLHMKKERGNETLDILIKKYDHITITNSNNYKISQSMYHFIEEKLLEYKIDTNPDKKQIMNKVDQLLTEMLNATDVYIWAEISPEPNIEGADQKVIECLRAIIKDKKVLDMMFKVKGARVRLGYWARKIREKSNMISKNIVSQRYDVVARCCPNLWNSTWSAIKLR
jgi:hypothetical protein